MRAPDRPSPRRSRVAISLAVLAAACFTALAWRKYAAFLYGDFDLALFAQAAHGVLHGSFFTTIRGMHWLGDHSSLVLVPLAPLTALLPPALALLLAQCCALALGAVPVHAIALRRTREPVLALACALLWLLHPALSWQALFEFHPETLAAPALLFAWDALDRRAARTACVAVLIALLTKEDAALIVLALAVHTALVRRERGLAAAFTLLAAASLALTFGWLKPRYGVGADYGMLYRDLGATPREVLAHLARDPIGALARLLSTPHDPTDSTLKQRFWHVMLVPYAYLPLLAPATLVIALPVLAEHLLAWRPEQHSVYYQYTALTLPFFALAAIDGLAQVRAWRPRAAFVMGGLAVLVSLLAQAQFGALAWRAGADPGLAGLAPQGTWPDGRTAALAPERARLLAALPAHGNVAASFVFLAHLAARDSVESLHHVTTGFYTFSRTPYPQPHTLRALIADYSWDDQLAFATASQRARLAAVLAANDLHPIAAAGEMAAYVRGARDTVELLTAVTPDPGVTAVAVDSAFAWVQGMPAQLLVAQGTTLEVRLRWKRTAPTDTVYAAELALVGRDGEDAASEPHLVGHAGSPPAQWAKGITYEERVRWVMPRDVAPGTYDLVVRPGRIAAQDWRALAGSPAFTIGRVAVTARH